MENLHDNAATPAETLMERLESTDIVVYEVLNASNLAAARQEFLENDNMIRPNFEYGNINRDYLEENLQTLEECHEVIEFPDLKKTHRLTAEIIETDLSLRNRFVLACDDYNNASSLDEKASAEEQQRALNHELFGSPDEATFYTLLDERLDAIDSTSLDEEDKALYDSLLADIGPLESTSKGRFRPKPETVERFSDMISHLYEGFFEHIPEGKDTFTTTEACDIVNEIIFEEIGATATDYRAELDDKISNVSVNHEDRIIKFPVNRAAGNFSREGLKAIIAHELCTHAYRAMVYEQSDVPAMSHALPGNETIDEGIAKCCEQAVRGKYCDSGIEHYINIGLANFKSKNFREVFEIQRKLNYLKGCRPGESQEEKDDRFHKKDTLIFNRTMRCFRGTGELPNNKDLVYYNGANTIWQYIEQHIDDPALLDALFLSGKADFLNPDQSRLIYETKVGN